MVAGAARLLWFLVRHHRRFCSFLGQQMGKNRLAGPAPLASGPGDGGVSPGRPSPESDVVVPAAGPLPDHLELLVAPLPDPGPGDRYGGQYVPAAYLLLTQAVLHLGGQALGHPRRRRHGGGRLRRLHEALPEPGRHRLHPAGLAHLTPITGTCWWAAPSFSTRPAKPPGTC